MQLTPAISPHWTAQGSQGPVLAANGLADIGQAALSASTETAPPWRQGRTQRAPPFAEFKESHQNISLNGFKFRSEER